MLFWAVLRVNLDFKNIKNKICTRSEIKIS